MTLHSTEHDPPTEADADRYGRLLVWDGRNSIWVFAPIEIVRDCPNRYHRWLSAMPEVQS